MAAEIQYFWIKNLHKMMRASADVEVAMKMCAMIFWFEKKTNFNKKILSNKKYIFFSSIDRRWQIDVFRFTSHP